MNIFILMGQSNMSGRGSLGDVEELSHPDVHMWRDGEWVPARDPLHTDKPIAAVGLGMSFAVDVIEQTGMQPIGLVPCAVGGSPLRRWMPGEDLYEIAVRESEAALQHGTLAGLLWHQGEHDSCNEEMATTYGQRLVTMIAQLRTELGAGNVPFIAGELGHFLAERDGIAHHELVNQTLRELERSVPRYTCVSAEGLTDVGDLLHLDAKSQRELGRRYAQAFERMIGKSEQQ